MYHNSEFLFWRLLIIAHCLYAETVCAGGQVGKGDLVYSRLQFYEILTVDTI